MGHKRVGIRVDIIYDDPHLTQALGMITPFEEIQRIRLERACPLLATTSLSLGDVAQQAGYPTRNRLLAAFRQRKKLTPAAYRLQHATDRNRVLAGPSFRLRR
jgi:AraC-like DNA-binding protein